MFADSAFTSENLRPMKRLAEKTVFLGFVTAWRLAAWPTTRSPDLVNATMDGVVRAPSALGMTTGSPPSMIAIQELVVPKSIPRILLIYVCASWPCASWSDRSFSRWLRLFYDLIQLKSGRAEAEKTRLPVSLL